MDTATFIGWLGVVLAAFSVVIGLVIAINVHFVKTEVQTQVGESEKRLEKSIEDKLFTFKTEMKKEFSDFRLDLRSEMKETVRYEVSNAAAPLSKILEVQQEMLGKIAKDIGEIRVNYSKISDDIAKIANHLNDRIDNQSLRIDNIYTLVGVKQKEEDENVKS